MASTLTLTFDQSPAGIPAGVVDRGRTDLVSTGPAGTRAYTVTLTVGSIADASTVDMQILDQPPSSNPVLTQLTSSTWSLVFDKAVYGPFRIRARAVRGGQVVDSVVRRASIRSPSLGLAYPANAERFDPDPAFLPTTNSVRLTEMNEGGTNRPLVEFWRSLVARLELGIVQSFNGRTGIVAPQRSDYAQWFDTNPMIMPQTTPNAFDDEFDAGDPAFENRSFIVYNSTDSVSMTRVGDIRLGAANIALANNQYRSTQRGSVVLAQFPANKSVFILKASTGSAMFTARMGIETRNTGTTNTLFLTSAATPPYITAAHNSGAGPGWTLFGPEQSYNNGSVRLLGRTVNAAAFYDLHDVAYGRDWAGDVYGLQHDETAGSATWGSCYNSKAGCNLYTATSQASTVFTHAMAGFFLGTGPLDQTQPGSIKTFDYLRKLPTYSYFAP